MMKLIISNFVSIHNIIESCTLVQSERESAHKFSISIAHLSKLCLKVWQPWWCVFLQKHFEILC